MLTMLTPNIENFGKCIYNPMVLSISMGSYEEHFGEYREGEDKVAHSFDTREEFLNYLRGLKDE